MALCSPALCLSPDDPILVQPGTFDGESFSRPAECPFRRFLFDCTFPVVSNRRTSGPNSACAWRRLQADMCRWGLKSPPRTESGQLLVLESAALLFLVPHSVPTFLLLSCFTW